jgi:hypothetical protein
MKIAPSGRLRQFGAFHLLLLQVAHFTTNFYRSAALRAEVSVQAAEHSVIIGSAIDGPMQR